eukprot:Gb_15812 [translate_table: standard]
MGRPGSAEVDQHNNQHDSRELDIASCPSSRKNMDDFPSVHKVGVPPHLKLARELKGAIKETFFPDDPLRQFKDQPKSQKFILGAKALFPILEWGTKYTLSQLKGDLIAGLTIVSLCIPQDIGYAKLANLQPQYGLFFAAMGSSRDIAIGPVAVVSILLGNLVKKEIDESDTMNYHQLVFKATFFAGVFQAALGIFRLGFLIDFLSHASIVGFMGGAAITIALQQLKGLLGIKNFTKNTDIISVMKSVWGSVHHGWNWETILIGTFFLIFLLLAKYVEAIAIGRTFASLKDYRLDGNKEMMAMGIMNMAGSLTSCYVATGSFSRSAVNYNAGCQTAVSNIVMSAMVFLTLEVITPLLYYTPNAILAAIIIFAVLNLVDFKATHLIWKIDKLDFIACIGAFFGVVFASVEMGLLIAVCISFAKILLHVTRPRTAILGNIPRTSIFRNIEQYPDATKVPGILIVRVDSAMYFSNSNYIRERYELLQLLYNSVLHWS